VGVAAGAEGPTGTTTGLAIGVTASAPAASVGTDDGAAARREVAAADPTAPASAPAASVGTDDGAAARMEVAAARTASPATEVGEQSFESRPAEESSAPS
jgi:hypothetical protein